MKLGHYVPVAALRDVYFGIFYSYLKCFKGNGVVFRGVAEQNRFI